MDIDNLQSTNRLLMVIIALMLRPRSDKAPSLRQQIEILSDLGLKPTEIATVLGKTSNHINKELTGIRKSRKGSRDE